MSASVAMRDSAKLGARLSLGVRTTHGKSDVLFLLDKRAAFVLLFSLDAMELAHPHLTDHVIHTSSYRRRLAVNDHTALRHRA
jgi:hypothetical protein